MLGYILIVLFLVLALSYFLTPLMENLGMRIGAIDSPGYRKVHSENKSRLGGLAMFVAFIIGAFLMPDLDRQTWGIIVAGSFIFLVGLVDDIKEMSPKLKLLGQILASLVLVFFGLQVEFITNPFTGGIFSLGVLSLPITILWLIGIINAVNLIDGLDGLAGGITGIAAVTLAIISFTQGQMAAVYLSLVLVVAIIGFLRYNFFPSRLFMGDCGSMFLGLVLGALSIMGVSKGATIITVFIPILVLGVPILDTFFAIIRRAINGKPIFKADKGHIHHRLMSLGFSHKQTVLVIYGVTILFSLSAVLLSIIAPQEAVVALIIFSVVVFWAANKMGIFKVRSDNGPNEIETES